MRDIIEKLMAKGLVVVFNEAAGIPVIRLYKGEELTSATLVATCSLNSGKFREGVEEALNAMLLDLDRK